MGIHTAELAGRRRCSRQALVYPPGMDTESVRCSQHSASEEWLICTHLRSRTGLGYFVLAAVEDQPAQAWCEECQRALDEVRGWTDRSEGIADFNVYCAACVRRVLSSHTFIAEMDR